MRKSILFVGQCFYNNWYLSRQLRKLGWTADVLNIDPNLGNREKFYHGEDFLFKYETNNNLLDQLKFFFIAIRKYDVFHFSNAHGMYFVSSFDGCFGASSRSNHWSFSLLYFFCKKVLRWNPFFISCLGLVLLFVFKKRIFNLAPYLPLRWDIKLLKKMRKTVTYSNNGCQDGVSQSSFRKWGPYCVCDICIWNDKPEVCSDNKNLKWGAFRNRYADFQILLGGNRADYNIDSRIHEVPGYYCLDKDFWKPGLAIPEKYKINKGNKILLYHAVGNYDIRTNDKTKENIKSTHIYLPLIERLKNEGYNVELIFAKDIPNKEVRFLMTQADIVLDMLTFGWFGANIREGMMLGKPCVCFLRKEWMEQARQEIPGYIDELPVINANPETIYSVLTDLITNKDKRERIGTASREFAVKWHSSEYGAREIDRIFTDEFNLK